jgi:two-component system cell cycle sensor histidine kinase/response regulator CckA
MVADVVMPKLSGLLLADFVEAVQPDISVLFISGYSQDSEEVGVASQLAGRRFLAKPFQPEDLAAAVGELLAERERTDVAGTGRARL